MSTLVRFLSLGLTFLMLLPAASVWAQTPVREQPCALPEQPLTTAQQKLYASLRLADTTTARARIRAGEKRECLIAVDVDYLMYKAFNGNTDQIRQTVYEAIAEASVIYERELNVKLTVSYFKIWDTQDPYPKTQNDAQHLQAVWEWWYKNNNGAGIRKQVVVAFTGKDDPDYGGIAYIGKNGLGPGPTAVIDHFTPDALITASSFYTFTIAHELGHVFGSIHTHNCAWPGGPIDYCERTEGTCYTGTRVYQLGTIMSYCYGSPTFHPLCLDAMSKNIASVNFSPVVQPPATPAFAVAEQTVTRPDPFLSWTLSDRAQTYQVQVAADNQFTSPIADSTVRFAQWQAGGLQNGQTYYVRVKARNDLGESGWSAPARLVVNTASALLPPKQRFPLRNALNVTSPDLVWDAVDGATGYQVQLSYNSSFDALYENKTVTLPRYTLTGYFASCGYCSLYWRVRTAKDGQFSDWSPAWQFRRLPRLTTAYPDSLQSAVNFQTSVPIMWGDNTGQEGVSTVQLAKNADFSALVWERKVAFNQLNDPDFTYNLMTNADELTPGTVYYYRVKTRYRLLNDYETPWKKGSFRTGAIDRKRWTYVNQANSPVAMGNFRDLLVEPSGAVWLATYTGLYRSTDRVNWTAFTSKTTKGVLPDGVQAIGQSASGQLAVTTNQGTFLYHAAADNWQNLGNPDGKKYFYASRILVDKNNRVYVTTSSKIYLYDQSIWKPVPPPDQLSTVSISSATLDPDGNLWILTGSYGVARYDGTAWNVIPAVNAPKNYYPYGIVTDRSGSIWTHGAFGIARLNPDQTWQFSASSTFGTNTLTVAIYQLAFDKQNNPVAVSAYDLHRYTGTAWERLSTNALLTGSYSGRLAFDDQNRVYVASTLYGLSIYDGRTITPAPLGRSQYCPGDAVPLSFTANFATGTAYQLELSDAGGTRFRPITAAVSSTSATVTLPPDLPPGNAYRLRVVSPNPSIIGDETLPFAVNSLPVINLSPATNQTLCTNSTLTVTADAGSGATYQWFESGTPISGATSSTYPVTTAGSYAVRAVVNGCTTTSPAVGVSTKEGVTAVATSQGPTAVKSPDAVTLTAAVGSGYVYQWLKNGTLLPGATGATYTAQTTGTYAVQVSNAVGCSAVSAGVAVQVELPLTTAQPTTDELVLIPNPVERYLTVIYGRAAHQRADLTLTDEAGRVVGRYALPTGQFQTILDLGALGAGSYLMTVAHPDHTDVRRVLKR